LVAEFFPDARGLRFETAEVRGEQVVEAEFAKQPLAASGLPEPEGASEEAEEARSREKKFDYGGPPESALRGGECVDAFDFGSGGLEELRVVDAGWTGGLAGEAAEAEIHFVSEGGGGGEFPVGNGAHERDAAAGAVAFVSGRVVGRAGRQAHAAVHALLEDGVVEAREVAWGLAGAGRIRVR
jgi:hypothetical protein